MSIGKVRVWVTGRKLEKHLTYNVTRKEWVKTIDYVNGKYPLWEMIIIYDKESNNELKRYYNYDNKKTYPLGVDDI